MKSKTDQRVPWTSSDVIGLAKAACVQCGGLGLRSTRDRGPCPCVLRAIFRACYNRYRYCMEKGASIRGVSLEFCQGVHKRRVYGRKSEEYMADFFLVSKRHLSEQEFRLFKLHFLRGADWRICGRQLKVDRGNFFHAVYRIEQRLGRVFRELRPYPLFPLSDYFVSGQSPPAALTHDYGRDGRVTRVQVNRLPASEGPTRMFPQDRYYDARTRYFHVLEAGS